VALSILYLVVGKIVCKLYLVVHNSADSKKKISSCDILDIPLQRHACISISYLIHSY